MTILKVGRPAPDFTLDTDEGTPLALSSLRGKPVVLFFYPKDDTTGCTAEACSFRDRLPKFDGLEARVIGVSPDTVRKHKNFKKKYDLPYTLLADVGHEVAERYGLWQEKSFWGRKYMGVVRTTFLIDAKGVIRHVFEKVQPEGHADEVAKELESLGA